MMLPQYRDLIDVRLGTFKPNKELFKPADFFNNFNEK